MITEDSHSRDNLVRYQSAKIQRPTFLVMWVSSLVAGGILALSSPIFGIMVALLFAGLAYVEYSEPRVELLLSKSGLRLGGEQGELEIPLDSIESISNDPMLDPVNMYVHYNLGSVAIPRRGRGQLKELLTSLSRYENSGLSERGTALPQELQAFLAKEKEKYGEEEVVAFGARSYFGIELTSLGTKRMRVFGAAMLTWGIVGLASSTTELTVMAAVGGIVGFAMLLSRPRYNKQMQKLWCGAGMVISPDGLALTQGDERGVLRWHEVLSVEKRKHRSFLSGGSGECLLLQIKGAELRINNVYEANLETIEQHINRNLPLDS